MSYTDLRPYVFNAEAGARAKEILAYALSHRESLTEQRNRASTGGKPPGADPNHVLVLDALEEAPKAKGAPGLTTPGVRKNACRVAYAIEQQLDGWVARVSIAVDKPRMYPSVGNVQQILALFGINESVKDAKEVNTEQVAPAKHAVNLTFAIDLKGKPIQP